MALRYLARRALQQRALVPRMPPSAGSRPVSTRGSSPPEGLHTNESKAGANAAAAASKGNKEPELLGSQKLDKVDFASMYKAAMESRDMDTCLSLMSMMGYAAIGVGFGLISNSYDTRNEKTITLEIKLI